MTHNLLLPNKYKAIGWWILIPSVLLGLILVFSDFDAFALTGRVYTLVDTESIGKVSFFSPITANITTTICGVLFLVGALLVSFSKEKTEDEYIASLRLSSLLWAVFVSHLLLLFSFIFIYGFMFLNVMVYNMFTMLIIFIVRFNYILYRSSKLSIYEK